MPLMITGVLAGPELGEIPVMFGSTMKGELLLSTPPTVTTTLTLPGCKSRHGHRDGGVGPTIDNRRLGSELHRAVPCDRPKLLPFDVTDDPTGADPTERLVIPGGGITVKLTPGLLLLSTVTMTLPVIAPLGTLTVIEVSLQFVTAAC